MFWSIRKIKDIKWVCTSINLFSENKRKRICARRHRALQKVRVPVLVLIRLKSHCGQESLNIEARASVYNLIQSLNKNFSIPASQRVEPKFLKILGFVKIQEKISTKTILTQRRGFDSLNTLQGTSNIKIIRKINSKNVSKTEH